MLQYYYQQGMLYKLRALGHGKQMDLTGGVIFNLLLYINWYIFVSFSYHIDGFAGEFDLLCLA